MSYLNELNQEQKRAVCHSQGPLLVVAGAGTGKTKTLTYRVFHLITVGVNPENILAITFTNKAAEEMRTRVQGLLARHNHPPHPLPHISTFHALGAKIIRENASLFNLTKNFVIYDTEDSLKIIKNIISRQEQHNQLTPKSIYNAISKMKNKGLSYHLLVDDSDPFSRFLHTVWKDYESTLQQQRAVDFDDLIIKPLFLLKKNKDLREEYHKRFCYIHVDEYQDTNEAQYQLLKVLTNPNKNICVVGDGDQSIYSWRGARHENIFLFQKEFAPVQVIVLQENYRSTNIILHAADTVIAKNNNRIPKKLFTQKKTGEKIAIHVADDEYNEAEFIAKTTAGLIKKGLPMKEIGVLYRTNFQSRVIEETFLKYAIPYHVIGTRFFARKEVKDVLAYIKAALNPHDRVSIERIINLPPRGIGKVTVARWFAGKEKVLSPQVQKKIASFNELLAEIKREAEILPPSRFLTSLLKKTGLQELLSQKESEQERWENVKELVSLASQFDNVPPFEGLIAFLERSALMQDENKTREEEEREGVSLMTVHAAKGLEFHTVFVAGLEENLFPHPRTAPDDDPEEERRLFYVALTRAKQKLYLTLAKRRTIFGANREEAPSPFLNDINPELLIYEEGNTHLETIIL